MFDILENNLEEKDDLPDVEEYSKKDLLLFEKEILGIYISGHPLDAYKNILEKYISFNSLEIYNDDNINQKDGQIITVGGIITKKIIRITKSMKAMAILKLEDFYGDIEIVLFPDAYEKYSDKLFYDSPLLITGFIKSNESEITKIICRELKLLSEIKS